ncbi:MAG: 3-methyl-2-oxobutanoate dehydrogenase subunit VorB [Prevotella sp.]|nr:3-methyl-2-oxobutanoate dehydrogenase subunit VorB [Alistipes senegalensis]MCM1357638.1 3-methyl-2-oxobutanoate dehydrogenase subunit VorB [Prevotella sp.]MCM1474533.1 3-methyl-2-oxobutanoate dehydrogenase subunit VorB [Muribaculaceae bacterium]MDE6426272.1 3-methyl-2-oxobutanoate dehydrogenase subunit VorB [Ruminococcus sp.]
MKGNEALAEAAIRAGCKCFFGYPITPQTELSAYMAKRMHKAGGVFLQAESEIAAINMVLGAASTGVRAMTSSSSPGVSLKSEGISYLAGSDLPAVIINVQRGGPGLGGIQPSQADYWQATKALGHGDFHLLVYAPASVQEMVDMVVTAFDRADKYRMPAMILADGLLGQMMEPVSFPEITVNDYDKSSWAANGHGNKREHHIINSLYLKPDELQTSVYDRFERYEKVKAEETDAELYLTEDCDILLCAYGATARVVKSAVNSAREIGIKAGMFRPKTLWPFPVKEINEACKSAKCLLDVEMSMGQMIDDVRLAINCSKPVHFFGRTGGIIPTPAEILEEIKKVGGAE